MFGYFRFLNQYSDYRAQAAYKNYYCGLCFALERHYGQLSRMLLSYDVTILAVALHAHPSPLCEKLRCVGCKECKKEYFQSEEWKKIAAINILLAAEKMSDDIADERSFKATVGSVAYKGIIRKASEDFPALRSAIRNGYAAIVEAEKDNRSVLQIGDCFADMMTAVLDAGFDVSDTVRSFVYEISRWLYYIDAMDDYDEDLKKKRFNPIAVPDMPFREYVLREYPQIRQQLKELCEKHEALLVALKDGSVENDILCGILKNTIPSVTALVLQQQTLPELLHCKSGNEWRAKA